MNVAFTFAQNEEECDDAECDGDNELGPYAVAGDNPEESENALLLGQTQQHHRSHIGTSFQELMLSTSFHFLQMALEIAVSFLFLTHYLLTIIY